MRCSSLYPVELTVHIKYIKFIKLQRLAFGSVDLLEKRKVNAFLGHRSRGHMRSLISQRQNSVLHCFEKCVARRSIQPKLTVRFMLFFQTALLFY